MSDSDDLFTSSNAGNYDAGAIRTLDARRHIRMRPGMYIGQVGNGDHFADGIYILLKEVIDNSVDEFTMGCGRRVIVTIDDDGMVVSRDFGRGIPLDKLRDCVSKEFTGGKFNPDDDGSQRVFNSSIGMNGIGLKATNFLSEEFEATSWRDGKYMTVRFREGQFVSQSKGSAPDEPNGVRIRFRPSQQIFPGFHFDPKIVKRRFQHYAWLNAGLSLEINGEKFYSRRGLLDLMDDKLEGSALYEVISHKGENLSFAFCHTNSSSENYYSFVNTQYTADGGIHLAAFKEGVVRGINEMAPKDKQYEPDDIRAGLFGAISWRMNDPQFESQTKNKLTSTDCRGAIAGEVKAAVVDFLYRHPDHKAAIFDKIEKNAAVRREIQKIKKASKERAERSSLRIKKLRDCKYHFNEAGSYKKVADNDRCQETMIFLTEGDSAAGSVGSARDANTQAVFALRGKVENCYGLSKAALFENEELYGIMQALGAEDNLEDLRYAKVVIATDADSDGMHIRLLLITFFLTFFPQLVSSEHLYVLETPLFRVRSRKNKENTIYCYNEKERDGAARKIGRDVEITRFKGLGEIDPGEFGQFIRSETIRLKLVAVDHARDLDSLLRFLMGKNTPERREYIMQNLV